MVRIGVWPDGRRKHKRWAGHGIATVPVTTS